MPIANLQPVNHPSQGVPLNLLAIAKAGITEGDMIDAPGRIVLGLRPWAEVTTEAGETVSLSAPNVALQQLVIDDIDKWVRARAAAGDLKPKQLMDLLVIVVDEENKRQAAARQAQQAPQS